MIKKFFIFTILFLSLSKVYSQQLKEIPQSNILKKNVRYLELGLGMPSIYFRDKTSSQLAYKGNGIVALHFANTKNKAGNIFREWNINAQLQNAKPDIKNLTNWNKSATIYGLDFMYRKLKRVFVKQSNKWNFFAGASIGSNLQFANIPSANNSYAYNLSWLQFGLECMIKRELTLGQKKIQITNQASVPVLGINVRPQSYVGLPPQDVIWSQNSEIGASFFKNPKVFSLNNNFVLKNEIGLNLLLKKSKLGLRYTWLYQYNTVSVNSLNGINTNVCVNYSFKLKNK